MKHAAVLASLVMLASCYRTRFELSPPVLEMPSGAYNEHFHTNAIGVIEVSPPVDLQRACYGFPPVAIEEQINPIAGLINGLAYLLLGIVHFNNVTVMCPMNPQPMQQQPYPPQPMPEPAPAGP